MLNIYRSEYDPKSSDEGGIDPLGLASLGDHLGQLFLPGTIERLKRPRFLSLVAIGLSIKNEVENGMKFTEHETDFWEAYEWNIVTGIIAGKNEDIKNLPATTKAKNAFKLGERLNADRYLKAPAQFGFHGVYKFLAKNLQIEFQDQPGESMLGLVTAWSKDRKLPGFLGNSDAAGYKERQDLVHHVRETIKSNQVSRDWRKDWSFIAQNFDHTKPGKNEKKYILDLLLNNPQRKEVLDFLMSSKGQKFLEGNVNERKFLEALCKVASADLTKTIQVILSFERFARILSDIFYDTISLLAEHRTGLTEEEISKNLLKKDPNYSINLYEAYHKVIETMEKHVDQSIIRRMAPFERFSVMHSPHGAVKESLAHHDQNQKNKSTGMKNSWFLNSNGRWIVRAGYTHRPEGLHDDSLVNAYRLRVFRLFLQDLKD